MLVVVVAMLIGSHQNNEDILRLGPPRNASDFLANVSIDYEKIFVLRMSFVSF